MSVQDEYIRKLIPVEEAVSLVKDGDYVMLAWAGGDPQTLGMALAGLKDKIKDVTVDQSVQLLTPYPWYQPGYKESFYLKSGYLRQFDREAHDQKLIEFFPISIGIYMGKIAERTPGVLPVPDFYMVKVSPPDKEGYCSFGHSVWTSNIYKKIAKTVIAEVDDKFIRTYGENRIHVSEIDYFVLSKQRALPERLHHITEEDIPIIEVIGELTATLVKDGDCVFLGGGDISARMHAYLVNKHELGLHTEAIYDGLPEMVGKGKVYTGKYKTIHTGKAVTTYFAGGENGLSIIDGNPDFEFYGVEYVDNPIVIAKNDNIITINNALAIDLSGQVSAESIGPRQYSGTGGQLDAVIGAMLSHGGRSVHVLPSVYKGVSSRIVPRLEFGTPITVPRTLVDYVVTEHGIANLLGKTERERAEELISLAHPDFRSELRKEARKMSIL